MGWWNHFTKTYIGPPKTQHMPTLARLIHTYAQRLPIKARAPEARGQRGQLPPLPWWYGGSTGAASALSKKTFLHCPFKFWNPLPTGWCSLLLLIQFSAIASKSRRMLLLGYRTKQMRKGNTIISMPLVGFEDAGNVVKISLHTTRHLTLNWSTCLLKKY